MLKSCFQVEKGTSSLEYYLIGLSNSSVSFWHFYELYQFTFQVWTLLFLVLHSYFFKHTF